MTWSSEKRAYFFGCECSPQLTEAEKLATDCLTGHQADGAFLKRYCAPDRRLITGTQSRLHGVPIPVARCVISELTKWLPEADHSTPGWSWPKELLPAVVMGHLRRPAVRIVGLRCGLWAAEGKLYFWADVRVFTQFRLPTQGWEPYGVSKRASDPPPMLRYPHPLTCTCGNADDAALAEPVVKLLEALAREIAPSQWADGPLVPREVYAARGPNPGAGPGPVDDSYDPDEAADDADVGTSGGTGTTSEKTAQAAEIKRAKREKSEKVKPMADFMGMVFENGAGKLGTYVDSRANFQRNWLGHVGHVESRVLFLCCGPDHGGVTAIVAQIHNVKTHLFAGHPPPPPHLVGAPQGPVGSTYVYGYFDSAHPLATPGSWNDAFYIGVGTVGARNTTWSGRWTTHVNAALAGNMLPRHYRIRHWLHAHPPGRLPANEHAARSGLVRKLYAFTGGYAKELSFFTEQFLISHGFGAHNLDNDTVGNAQTGFYIGISRPFIFNAGIAQHVFCWNELVTTFSINPNDPRIVNELAPALLTLVAASFVPQLNAALNAIGLHPVPHVPQGRLHPNAILYSHLNVTGAGDCMLSYQTNPLRYYRIDLRLSKSSPHLMINMRPGGVGNAAFTASITGHVFGAGGLPNITVNIGPLPAHYAAIRAAHPRNPNLPVMNANNWPYYKPMAHNANGYIADWFPVGWPVGPNIVFPNVLVTLPNWLLSPGGAANLSLDAALELILIGFP